MSTPVQSSKISTVSSELGFSGKHPGREAKIFEAELNNCNLDTLSQGTPFPFWKADTPEAQNLAVHFCEDNHRGQRLWPDDVRKRWLAWTVDRTKILRLVAHALSLKAYYKYQKDCCKRKKKASLKEGTMSDGRLERELSPESRRFVAPPPPRGTKRRPTKRQNNPRDPEVSKTFAPPMALLSSPTSRSQVGEFDESACIEHIKSLNPGEDVGSLKDFNREWLSNPNSAWLIRADRRIHIFMHLQKTYDAEAKDSKILALVTSLKKGTEIEELLPEEYNIMEERTVDRLRYLSTEMFQKGFIEKNNDGEIKKTRAFYKFWMNRHEHWKDSDAQTHQFNAPDIVLGNDDPFDGPLVNDTAAVLPPPRKTLLMKRSRLTKQAKPALTQARTSSSRRKFDDLVSPTEGPGGSNSNKRQKTSSAGQDAAVLQSTEALPVVPTSFRSDEDNLQDTDTAEHIRFAEGFLSSPTAEIRQPLITSAYPNSHDNLMTPTSPTPTMGTTIDEDQILNPPRLASKPPENPQTPKTPITESQRMTPVTPTSKALNHPEICLIFQNSAGNYDLKKPVPALKLRESSLSTFFEYFAERSSVPLQSLDCLTFSFFFAGNNVEVLHKESGEDEWMQLKNNIRRLFGFARKRHPKKNDFEIWVDIGDTREAAEEDEDLGGL